MGNSSLLTRKAALAILALALAAGAGGWYALSDAADPANLTELNPAAFDQLKDEFNAAAGNVRVIVLLSPS